MQMQLPVLGFGHAVSGWREDRQGKVRTLAGRVSYFVGSAGRCPLVILPV